MIRLLVFLALSVCLAAESLTVEEIAAKYAAARGGLEKMQAIKSLKLTGKMTMSAAQTEAPVTLFIKRPDRVRIEIQLGGNRLVQAFDGTTAWSINPNQGPAPRPADQEEALRTRETADFDGPLVNSKDKGIRLELLGQEDVQGSPAYKIKAIRSNGRSEYHWVDARSFLEIKSSRRRPFMGREMEFEAFPADYRPLQGVLLPASIEQRMEGKPLLRIQWQTMEANPALDEAVFRMPTGETR